MVCFRDVYLTVGQYSNFPIQSVYKMYEKGKYLSISSVRHFKINVNTCAKHVKPQINILLRIHAFCCFSYLHFFKVRHLNLCAVKNNVTIFFSVHIVLKIILLRPQQNKINTSVKRNFGFVKFFFLKMNR